MRKKVRSLITAISLTLSSCVHYMEYSAPKLEDPYSTNTTTFNDYEENNRDYYRQLPLTKK